MNVEFHEDENKNIWFTFASDIQYRDISKKGKLSIGDVDPKTLHKELKASQEAQKDQLIEELNTYEDAQEERSKENHVRQKMLDFMEGYYDKMRNEMQLTENYD